MQWERDEDEEETKESKHGEERICRVGIHVHGGGIEMRKEKNRPQRNLLGPRHGFDSAQTKNGDLRIEPLSVA